MKNPFNHPAMIDISLFLARLTLGLFMLLNGWTKIYKLGVAKFVDSYYMPLVPSWLPESIAKPYGYAVPWLEFLTGLLIVLGLFTRWAGGIMALVLMSIFIAVVSKHGIQGGEDAPFHVSIIYAAMAFVLSIVGPGHLALDPLYFGGGNAGGKGK